MISACPLVIPVFPSVVGRVERSATRHLFRPAAAWRVTLRFTRPTIYPDAMPDYRRNRVPGATYFFTTNLRDRRSGLLVTQIEALREAVRGVRRQLPFRIDAWVVLPDHMHCLWTLPEGDSDFPERWRGIKAAFSRTVPDPRRSAVKSRKGERGIWQRGYWEHTIRDDGDYAAHMDYIHFNPVKHGLVESPGDWLYSSLRRCIAAGLYPPEWLGGETGSMEVGER
jgi:putative transposase